MKLTIKVLYTFIFVFVIFLYSGQAVEARGTTISTPVLNETSLETVYNKSPGIINYHLQSEDIYNPIGEYLYFGNIPIKAETKNFKMDEDGIPLVKINGVYQKNIVVIAQYGLQQFSYFLKDKKLCRYAEAEKMANWLVDNQDKSIGNWYFNYAYEVGGTNITLESPFTSAMAQGQAISLLVRIYNIEKNPKYIKAAELALKPLKIPIKDSGLRDSFKGHVEFAEFPTTPPVYILNGFMFCILGLYDLSYVNPYSEANRLFAEGINSLIYMLPYYDNPKDRQSFYHLGFMTMKGIKPTVNHFYHNVHIVELKALNSIYPNETFKKYYVLWKSYLRT